MLPYEDFINSHRTVEWKTAVAVNEEGEARGLARPPDQQHTPQLLRNGNNYQILVAKGQDDDGLGAPYSRQYPQTRPNRQMSKAITAFIFVVIVLGVGGCTRPAPASPPAAQYPNRAAQSLRLNAGMTEPEVVAALGEPASSELATCGQALGTPWSCKFWKYYGGRTANNLTVTFSNAGGKGWIVSGWQLY
jgi:hypothetical protein